MKNTALTLTKANELGGAIQELAELSQKSIIQSDDAAKKRVLTSFIQDNLMAHAGELLASWFTLEQEYKPMIQAEATRLGHCLSILQRRDQLLQQAQKSVAPAATEKPDNVVELKQTTTTP